VQGKQSQAVFSDALWWEKRQWAKTEAQKVLSESQETLFCFGLVFYCERDGALEQVALIGCGVSIVDSI